MNEPFTRNGLSRRGFALGLCALPLLAAGAHAAAPAGAPPPAPSAERLRKTPLDERDWLDYIPSMEIGGL